MVDHSTITQDDLWTTQDDFCERKIDLSFLVGSSETVLQINYKFNDE